MPSIPALRPPGLADERRASVERRLGERRQQAQHVPRERRTSGDRRRPPSRRETADGHLRHAIQLTRGALADPEIPNSARDDLERATRRMWLALREVERLVAAHRRLGVHVRKIERGPRGQEPAGS